MGRVGEILAEFSDRFTALLNERSRHGQELLETERAESLQDFSRFLAKTREDLSQLRGKFFADFLERTQSLTPEERQEAFIRMEIFMSATLKSIVVKLSETLNTRKHPSK